MFKLQEVYNYNYYNYRYTAESDNLPIGNYHLYLEIRAWLRENNIRYREHNAADIWYFETQEDAILFILRWS